MTESPRSIVRAADTQTVLSGAMRACDAAIVVGTGLAAYLFRHGSVDLSTNYLIAIAIGTLLTMNYMHVARLYQFRNLSRIHTQIGPLTAAWVAVILSLIALGYFTKTSGSFSRAWMGMWFSMSYAGFVLLRLGVVWQLAQWRRDGRLSVRVAIVGAGEEGRRLVRHLVSGTDRAIQIIGIFDDDRESPPEQIEGYAVLGTVDDLVREARENAVDDIIVAQPWSARDELARTMKKLHALPVNVRLAPDLIDLPIAPLGFTSLAGVPLLDIYERPLSGWDLIFKTVEDRVLAAILLVLTLPLFALVAVMIRIDSPGPAIFRQKRYGFNNNEITVFKFRTMAWTEATESAVPQATRTDPRVTRVGAFLRRTSLDELPQLINVLRGDMSLVGPRPHAVAHNEMYAEIIDDYLSRHRVKPGITGWAQIHGLRGETDTPEKMQARVRYDLYYIDNWSLLLDLKILFLTLFVGFVGEHAY